MLFTPNCELEFCFLIAPAEIFILIAENPWQ